MSDLLWIGGCIAMMAIAPDPDDEIVRSLVVLLAVVLGA